MNAVTDINTAFCRELAAEHHRDLNAMGCTCRWNSDPDNGERYITRDRNCPMHGIDPDAARDDAQDRKWRDA